MLIKISDTGGNWDNPSTWYNITGSTLGRIPRVGDIIIDTVTSGNLVINIDTPVVEFYMYNGRAFNLTFNATLNIKGFLYTNSITMLGSFGINCPVNATLYSDGVTPFRKILSVADSVIISLAKISDFTFAQNSVPNTTLGTEGFGIDDGTYTFPTGWVQDIFTGGLFVDDSFSSLNNISGIIDGPNGDRRMIFNDTVVGPDSVISKSFSSSSNINVTVEWNQYIATGSTNTNYTLLVSIDPTFATFDTLTIPVVASDSTWHAITPISLSSAYKDVTDIYFKWLFTGNGDGTTIIGFDDIRIAGTLLNISITQIHTNIPVWKQSGTITGGVTIIINDAYNAAVVADFYINSNNTFSTGLGVSGNNNLYLNANLSISGLIYKGRLLKYLSGIVNIDNLELQNELLHNVIVDISPLVVSNITLINTVTINSLLTCTSMFLSNDIVSPCRLLGSFGFNTYNLSVNSIAPNVIFSDGITYTVNNSINIMSLNNVVYSISSPTGRAKLNIGLNAIQNVACVNLTNIDCSGGLRLNVFGDSVLTNCINVYNIPNSDLPQIYSTF